MFGIVFTLIRIDVYKKYVFSPIAHQETSVRDAMSSSKLHLQVPRPEADNQIHRIQTANINLGSGHVGHQNRISLNKIEVSVTIPAIW